MAYLDRDGDAIMDQHSSHGTNMHTSEVDHHIMTAMQNNTDKILEKLEVIIGACNLTQAARHPILSYFNLIRGPPPPPPPRNNLEGHNELLQISEAKIKSLEEQLRAQDKKFRETELSYRSDLKRLNTIIFKAGAVNTGLPDDQVRADFCSMRDRILRITRGHYQATNVSFSPRNESTTIHQRRQKWLESWSLLTNEIRNYRIQGAIFNIIENSFFARPVFGVEKDLEEQLQNFENNMEKCSAISQIDLVEWRRRTVMAAKHMGSRSDIVIRVAKKIHNTLEPALTQSLQNTSQLKVDQLKKDLLALCENALELSVTLRSEKCLYEVTIPERDMEIVEEDARMELVAMNGKPSHLITRVDFIVFGGLEKTTLIPDNNSETVKLEKAQVVGHS